MSPCASHPRSTSQPAFVERRRLERIVVNLLDNAQEHGAPPIRLSVTRRDGVITMVVEDHGPGIRPEDRERIFERFARGRRAGSRGDSLGSGLGLALVAEHVRLLRRTGQGGGPRSAAGRALRRRDPGPSGMSVASARRLGAVVVLVSGLVLTGCGVATQEQPTRIGRDEVPFGLLRDPADDTSTTTGPAATPATTAPVTTAP